MPVEPHPARNEHGGSADYWADYTSFHGSRVEQNAPSTDGMGSSNGGGELNQPPRGLRFMEDAQAAGNLMLAGEQING